MKKAVSIMLSILLLFSIGIISAFAENNKINPKLQSILDELPDGETVDAAIWTTYTVQFNSGYDLTEYVDQKTREKLGILFQINTLEDVDTWKKTYNAILFEIEAGNRKVVIEKLGLSDEIIDQACNFLIAKLTKEQILAAAELDEVDYIEPNPFNAPSEDPGSPPSEPLMLVGDADEDGEVTILDATHIQRALAEIIPIAELDTWLCDTDFDGEITIVDATRIQRRLAYAEYEIEDP